MGTETIRSELLHEGARLGLRQETFHVEGTEQAVDYLVHPGGAAVVALDPGARHVLLVRQFRRPVGEALWQLPMGFRDGDEPAEDAARRELAEETGGTAGAWRRVAAIRPSPGTSDELLDVFLAEDVRLTGAQDLEPGEAGLTLAWWPVTEALAAVRDGRISCGITIASLLLALTGPDRQA